MVLPAAEAGGFPPGTSAGSGTTANEEGVRGQRRQASARGKHGRVAPGSQKQQVLRREVEPASASRE